MNNYTIAGNLGANPTIRYTKDGTPVTTLSIAVSDRTRQPDGTWQDEFDCWQDITVWRKQAEAAATLQKGQRIIATGRLKTQTWTTKDGQEASKRVLEAQEIGVSMLYGPASQTGPQQAPSQTPAAPGSLPEPDEDIPF